MTDIQQRYKNLKAEVKKLEEESTKIILDYFRENSINAKLEHIDGTFCLYSIGLKSFSSYNFEDEPMERKACSSFDLEKLTAEDIVKLVDSNKTSIEIAHKLHKYLLENIF